MRCPKCDSKGACYATKDYGVVKHRYRKCENCGHRFKTFEEIIPLQKVRKYHSRNTIDKAQPICN